MSARTYHIRIRASGLDHEADDFEDRFFNAGCDDATISVQGGLIFADFEREAESIVAATLSAVANVEAAGAQIHRIDAS